MQVPYVDLSAQYLDKRDDILASIDEVLKSGAYIMGEACDEFEKRFAEICKVKHAIGVANGTDALVIVMKAMGIGEGDEVITAPNSWVSSASSIALAGARPVFVDVCSDQNMDPTKLEEAITPNTKAIMPVHLTGRIADMNPICEIANKHGLYVIEDAAQAIGASYQQKMAGSFGDAASFSLHPLKNLNGAGDGGAITTNNEELAEKIRLLRNHGIKTRDNILFWGYNSRLDSIQAAILNCKMDSLDEVTSTRRENAKLYQSRLGKIVQCPSDHEGSFDVYHVFVIQTDKRDELQNYLKEQGIGTAVHYAVPIHLNPCSKYLGYKMGDFPNAEEQSKRILSLPIHQNLSTEQINYVCDKIIEFLQK